MERQAGWSCARSEIVDDELCEPERCFVLEYVGHHRGRDGGLDLGADLAVRHGVERLREERPALRQHMDRIAKAEMSLDADPGEWD